MARRVASRADRIGLRAAMADRLMPFMVAAMSFLAALALAGSIGAASLASHWLSGAQGLITIEVPNPDAPAQGNTNRVDAVLALLHATTGYQDAHRLSGPALAELLKPWLGSAAAGGDLPIALPAVIVAHGDAQGDSSASTPERLATVLDHAAPGTLVDSGARWAARLGALTDSLRASAAAVLLVVTAVAAAVVGVAVRAGLAQRREAIEIIHGLGALDSDIASQFARRAMRLAALGGLFGALAALPVLIWLAHLSSQFVIDTPATTGSIASLPSAVLAALPTVLWASPVIFTIATALIGWLAAQVTVRGWLRKLS